MELYLDKTHLDDWYISLLGNSTCRRAPAPPIHRRRCTSSPSTGGNHQMISLAHLFRRFSIFPHSQCEARKTLDSPSK